MTPPEPIHPELLDRRDESSELVTRLRSMRWPEPSPDTRLRCWEILNGRLGGLDADPPAPAPASPETASGERRHGRHEFATRPCEEDYRSALGQRVAPVRRSLRRR